MARLVGGGKDTGESECHRRTAASYSVDPNNKTTRQQDRAGPGKMQKV